MKVTIEQKDLDDLLLAMDCYSTISAHRQKHVKGLWKDVVRLYAKATGLTQKQADEHLFPQIP